MKRPDDVVFCLGLQSDKQHADTPLKSDAFTGSRGASRSRLATSLTLAAMSLGSTASSSSTSPSSTPRCNAMGTALGGGVAELQWVVSAYTIAFAAFILTAGALGDRIGAKRVFMAGFAIFTGGLARLRAVAQCHRPDRQHG